MERTTYVKYDKNEPTVYQPQPETSAHALGSMVLGFVVFESVFSGIGGLGGTSVLGSSESFAHTTAHIAGVNNVASAGYKNNT